VESLVRTIGYTLASLLGLAGGLIALGQENQRAEAWHAASFALLTINDDSFRNYDFTDQNESWDLVDWPVTMVFWNSAEIDRVKGIYDLCCDGAQIYARVNDGAEGSGPVWDDDGGIKDWPCSFLNEKESTWHMRLYADSDDQLYTPGWGFYVLGTTHEDYHECTFPESGRKFGWSEWVESNKFVPWIRAKGYTAWDDYMNFSNYEPYWEEQYGGERHVWENDGMSSWVYIP
jgi:hypothetical protein